MNVHLTRKHSNIDQLDGASEIQDNDEKYENSKHYWESGQLGTVYQSFISANDIIENSDMSEEEKIKEKAKILEARKTAFGNSFGNFQ